MKKKQEQNISEYIMACVKCATKENLTIAGHRNTEGNIVGWVFVCQNCCPSVASGNITVRLAKIKSRHRRLGYKK